jgi:hypothetical protein
LVTAKGGVEAIIDRLKSFPDNSDFQFSGCEVLAYLVQCKQARAIVLQKGGIQVLAAAYKYHITNITIRGIVVDAFCQLSETDAARMTISRVLGIDNILMNFTQSFDSCTSSCRLLLKLGESSQFLQEIRAHATALADIAAGKTIFADKPGLVALIDSLLAILHG